jgi:hypothetical protein
MQQISKNQSNKNSITEGKNLSGKITCTQEKIYCSVAMSRDIFIII